MTKLSSTVTVEKLKEFISNSNKIEIADFIKQRFEERYINPINKLDSKDKHGFSIMAVCCLMIESLESYKNGWESTENKSGRAFKQFLTTENEFVDLKNHSTNFYKNVRCGILHQSETTDGWKIVRKDELFNSQTKTINASKFLLAMETTLDNYANRLKVEDWDSSIWDNLRRKLRKIINNCG